MSAALSRRALLRGTGGVAAGLAAAACGAQQKRDPHTLLWWDYSTTPQPYEDMFRGYRKRHPDVTIVRRSVPYADIKRVLLQAAAARKMPDIVVINDPDHQQFADLGIAEDLTDRIKQWGQKNLYVTSSWKSTMYKGRDYGLPADVNCLALWYDAALFEKEGLQPPKTWPQLLSTAKKLSNGSRFGLAVSAPNDQQAVFQWLPFLWQAGGDLTRLTAASARKALELWVDLLQSGGMSREVLSWAQADVATEFINGRAAMMVNGPWEVPTVKEQAPKLKWNVAPLPRNVSSASCLGGENYLIVKGGNVDLAWDFLKYTQQPDVLKRYLVASGSLPTRSDIAGDKAWSDPVSKVFVEELNIARPRAYGARYPEISDAVVQAIQAALSGATSVPSALSTARAVVNPLLRDSA